MLTTKTGQFHPDLEQEFVNDLSAIKSGSPYSRIAIIIPSKSVRNRLYELVTVGHKLQLMGIEFYTLSALIIKLYSELTDSVNPLISDSLFLEQLILTKLKKTGQFSKFNITSGLPASLLSTLRDLIESGIVPENLNAAIKDRYIVPETDEFDIFRLYDIYQKYLAQLNILTSDELIKLVTPAVPESNLLKSFTHIYYYGFYDLTGIQTDFIENIAKNYPGTMYFPYRENHPAFRFLTKFYTAAIHRISSKIVNVHGKHGKIPVQNILDNMFSINPVKNKNPFDITFFDTSGKYDEIWYIAKEILRLVEKENVKFSDIAVTSRSFEEYKTYITEIFSQNHIPYSSSEEIPAIKYPLLKTIRQLILLHLTDFNRNITIDVLKSPYFNLSEFKMPVPAHWDILSRRLNIVEGYNHWSAQLSRWINKDYPLTEAEETGREEVPVISMHQTQILLAVINKINTLFTGLPASANYSEYSARLINIISELIKLPGDSTETELDIYNMAISSLETIKSFDLIAEQVDLQAYLELVLKKFDTLSVPIGTDNIPGVKITDIMSSRGIPVKILFIIGLNEKLFPRLIREDPFLRDTARKQISAVLGVKLDEKLTGYGEEKLLFYLTINSVSEKLYCSYQRADDNGRPQIPSLYIRELQQILTGTTLLELLPSTPSIPRRLSDKLKLIDTKYLTPKEIAVKYSFDKNYRVDTYLSGLGWDITLFRNARQMAELQNSNWKTLSEYDGITGPLPEFTDKLKKKGISPTSLELYGKCPFKYFIQKVMEIEPLEEPVKDDSIESIELGRIYHRLLQSIYSDIDFGNLSVKQITSIIEKNTGDYISEYEKNPVGLYPVVWEVIKLELKQNIMEFILSDIAHIRESGYIPAYFEQKESSAVPLSEPKNTIGMKFQGKADRIDILKNNSGVSFRIIDYKYSKYDKNKDLTKDSLNGEHFQLPVYQQLIKHFLTEKIKPSNNIEIQESMLLAMRKNNEGRYCKKTIPGDFWKVNGSQFSRIIENYLNYINSGAFFIYLPKNRHAGDYCSYCPYKTICRKNQQPLLQRIKTDKLTEKYREIRKY